jgi:hypothetical protein
MHYAVLGDFGSALCNFLNTEIGTAFGLVGRFTARDPFVGSSSIIESKFFGGLG